MSNWQELLDKAEEQAGDNPHVAKLIREVRLDKMLICYNCGSSNLKAVGMCYCECQDCKTLIN